MTELSLEEQVNALLLRLGTLELKYALLKEDVEILHKLYGGVEEEAGPDGN
jgi:hypothetical protein